MSKRGCEMPTTRRWTDERVQELRDLWARGMSASEIAVEFTRVTHVTWNRNMVIGKVHRLGIQRHHSLNDANRRESALAAVEIWKAMPRKPPKPRVYKPKLKAAKFGDPANQKPPKPPTVVAFRDEPYGGDPVALELATACQCRWPIGDPFVGFCGAPKMPGRSYCRAHTVMSIQGGRIKEAAQR